MLDGGRDTLVLLIALYVCVSTAVMHGPDGGGGVRWC